MKSTFKILFYIKKKAAQKNGEVPIMVRITLNGKISQFSLKCNILPDDWDITSGRAKGREKEARELNTLLDNARASLNQHFRELSEKQPNPSPDQVKNAYLGLFQPQETLLKYFSDFNNNMKQRVGRSIENSTYNKYVIIYAQLEKFMLTKYRIKDIPLKEITHQYIIDFELYLRTKGDSCHNTVMGKMKKLKRVILLARNQGLINANPFSSYKIHFNDVDRGYLTAEEIQSIMEIDLSTTKHLEISRDAFIFSCYTGLAYVDVKSLTESHIKEFFDEHLWVITKRKKTQVSSNIRLLEVPKKLIEKYKNQSPKGKLFPIQDNSIVNLNLKTIAKMIGLEKRLTFHLARHSFATTITLSQGVPIESVSKMLGHKSIKTTQIYARITNQQVSKDMEMLSQKLNSQFIDSSPQNSKPTNNIDVVFENLHLDEKLDMLLIEYNIHNLAANATALEKKAADVWSKLSDKAKQFYQEEFNTKQVSC